MLAFHVEVTGNSSSKINGSLRQVKAIQQHISPHDEGCSNVVSDKQNVNSRQASGEGME